MEINYLPRERADIRFHWHLIAPIVVVRTRDVGDTRLHHSPLRGGCEAPWRRRGPHQGASQVLAAGQVETLSRKLIASEKLLFINTKVYVYLAWRRV
jgi:hypothetical protein